jgi:hypothetical protein
MPEIDARRGQDGRPRLGARCRRGAPGLRRRQRCGSRDSKNEQALHRTVKTPFTTMPQAGLRVNVMARDQGHCGPRHALLGARACQPPVRRNAAFRRANQGAVVAELVDAQR